MNLTVKRRSSAGPLAVIAAATLLAAFLSSFNPSAASTESEEEIALSVATLLRSARAVISQNQELINDASKGDKGITPEMVLAKARENYKKALNKDVDSIDKQSKHGKLLAAELKAIAEVMTEAQERINQPGVGFKGFLPAVFARLVTQKFRTTVGEQANLKLTAPKELVRNRVNRPDDWEDAIIEKQFRAAGYEKGKAVKEEAAVGGKPAFRLILPEYYDQSCMACHGEPKGERDISGGRKDGMKIGDLGGAISVTLFR